MPGVQYNTVASKALRGEVSAFKREAPDAAVEEAPAVSETPAPQVRI